MSTETFIQKAIKKHGSYYSYVDTAYIHSKTKVVIICPIHGKFEQRPDQHLQGKGCKTCGFNKTHNGNNKTIEEFTEKANEVHNFKYDYSLVKYVNSSTKVKIICKNHGEFLQTPHSHNKGNGCPDCGKIARAVSLTQVQFEEKANKAHNSFYDYSRSFYIATDKKGYHSLPFARRVQSNSNDACERSWL